MKLNESVLQAFEKHVLAEYPKEACGLVVADEFIACQNIHPNPTKSFRIDPAQFVLAQNKGALQAVLHSHPYNTTDVFKDGVRPEFPSAKDIDGFNQTKVPWGIVATEGQGLSEFVWLDDNDRPPLTGRIFCWGNKDCYALVRDWYKQEQDIELPNFPRAFGWWNVPETANLIEDWLDKAGFKTVSPKEVTVGDVCLMRMGFRHNINGVNHLGVIVGPNQLLHQPSFGYSHVMRLDSWFRSVARYVRYSATK